jgi:hypothetical protein
MMQSIAIRGLSFNRSVPSILKDTTSTPADYIMDSYAVRGPCERPFLNRGIVHSHKKNRSMLWRQERGRHYGLQLHVDQARAKIWYLVPGYLTVVNLHTVELSGTELGTPLVFATSFRRDHRKSKFGLRHAKKKIELYCMTKSEF